MSKKFIRKIALVVLITAGSVTAFGNCFGKFALVRKFYAAHDGIEVGSGMLARFVKTILMYFPFSILYFIGFLFDVILFNLIEFWTGNNVIGLNEYNKNGEYVKSIQKDDESVTLKYSGFGERLDMTMKKGEINESFVALRNEPGKLYKEVNGKLNEIEVSSETIGSKMILKLAQNGKLKSSKVIEVKDYKEFEAKLATQIQ